MRKQITEEAKAGIWTPDQARKRLLALERDQKENQQSTKRQKTVRSPSPNWDSELIETDDSDELD